MKAFTFTINGKEDFAGAMALVQPEWMRLRKPKGGGLPDLSRDEEFMDQACKNVSRPGKKIARKKLA